MGLVKHRNWLLGSGLLFLLAAAWLGGVATPARAGTNGPTMDCVKEGDLFGLPGDIITVNITCDFSPPASNTGGVDNIDLDDFLDVGLTFVPGSLDCPDATNEVIEPLPKLQATCDWHPLAVGETQVQMTVDIQIEDVSCNQTLTERFIANYDIDSDKTVNAQDDQSLEVRVLCPDDVVLEIEKTPDDETISGGETATFAIEVTNSGNIDVIVRLVDQLPGAAGLDWNLVSGPPGCEPDANDLVDCTFGLPTQGPIIFSAETDEGECGEELLNEATVTFVEPDENFDLAPQQIGPILEASDTGSISVECVGGGGTPPPTGRPTPDVDVDQVPTPRAPAPQPGAGKGPSVTTGDSGLTDTETVAGWQVALLATLLAGSLFGSVLAYRRLR